MGEVLALGEMLAARTVWRAGQGVAPRRDGEPSGHAALDAALPDGGWPRRALTELLLPSDGVGEIALLLPTLSGIRRIDRPALRWALAAVAIATAAGVVQGLGLAWRWPLFAGLDLGVALLAANLALWRFGAPFERREGPVLRDLGIAAVALVTMGAVRGAFSGVVLLAAQPLGVLLLAALALAAQQARRQRRGGTA